MTIALLTNTGQAGTQNGVTTGAIDTSGASLIVVNASWYNGTTADGTLTDSASNTWSLLTKKSLAVSISNRLFYCANPITSATHTFTYNGTSIFPSLDVSSFSGAATSSPFDVENGATGSGTTVQPGTVTPSENGELIVSGTAFSIIATVSIDSSLTITNQTNFSAGANEGGALAYLVQSTAAAINPTWTSSASQVAFIATIATFKQQAAGGRASKNIHPWTLGVNLGMGLGMPGSLGI